MTCGTSISSCKARVGNILISTHTCWTAGFYQQRNGDMGWLIRRQWAATKYCKLFQYWLYILFATINIKCMSSPLCMGLHVIYGNITMLHITDLCASAYGRYWIHRIQLMQQVKVDKGMLPINISYLSHFNLYCTLHSAIPVLLCNTVTWKINAKLIWGFIIISLCRHFSFMGISLISVLCRPSFVVSRDGDLQCKITANCSWMLVVYSYK